MNHLIITMNINERVFVVIVKQLINIQHSSNENKDTKINTISKNN